MKSIIKCSIALHHICLFWILGYVALYMCSMSPILALVYIIGLALTIRLTWTYSSRLNTLSFVIILHIFAIMMQLVSYGIDGSLNSFIGYFLGSRLCDAITVVGNKTVNYRLKIWRKILREYINRSFLCYSKHPLNLIFVGTLGLIYWNLLLVGILPAYICFFQCLQKCFHRLICVLKVLLSRYTIDK